MKIGLLLIATGKYDIFISPLVESAKKFFLKNHDVHYFLFTDSKRFSETNNFHIIEKAHEPFPAPTLKRYETFFNSRKLLSNMDYLFYCDADMLFVSDVGDEIIGERVATIHPNYLGGRGTPETREISKACIRSDEKLTYFAGGFNGGTTEQFLLMSYKLATNIKLDLQNNIIAIWHDESHLNRYFLDNPPSVILSPSYCYPESYNLPFDKKLIALDKNHKEIRS